MKNYLILLVLATLNANAQLGDKDSNGMTYGQRYIQNIEDNNRKPNTPLSGSGDSYRREALARPNTGLTDEQLERVRIYREEEAARLKKESDISSAQWNFESRYYNYFKTSGIDSNDAGILSSRSVYKSDNTLNASGFQESLEKVSYCNAFNSNLDKYSYDELTSLIYQYTDLHYTAIESCKKLREKFPDKKFENDLLFVKVILKYYHKYRSMVDLTNPYFNLKYTKDEDNFKKNIDNQYRAIYRAYPDEIEQLLINPANGNEDIVTLATLFCMEDNKPKTYNYQFDIYYKKIKCNTECERLKNIYKNTPNPKVLGLGQGYSSVLNAFDYDDIEGRLAFAKLHGIPPIKTMPGYNSSEQLNSSSYFYAYKGNDKHSDLFKKIYPDGYKMLLKLVEMEDSNALEIYAVRIYCGLEKEKEDDFHLWLEKAIEKGNSNAANLLYSMYTRYHQK